MIYLDNNATTLMNPETRKIILKWMNKGNPSSSYASAQSCRELMQKFREFIANNCKFKLNSNHVSKNIASDEYRIIFTSCASESNCAMINSIVDNYTFLTKTIPHIIISSIEHKSIIICVEQLYKYGRIDLTLINPDVLGFIHSDQIKKAVKQNTALICIMHANNETGCINNIKQIGLMAHEYKIPFFTDAVQTFGKFLLNPIENNVDAFSASFHKLHGPTGVGILVIKEQLIHARGLCSFICGNQNDGLRGGTENIPAIAGAFCGMEYNLNSRFNKNKKLLFLKKKLIHNLSINIPCKTYRKYLETCRDKQQNTMEIVFISDINSNYLPNTLLLSIVKRTDPPICNKELKNNLEKYGIIISIGSACNTSNSNASHVLTAMNVEPIIKRGTLRISIGDTNTEDEINVFIKRFLDLLSSKNN